MIQLVNRTGTAPTIYKNGLGFPINHNCAAPPHDPSLIIIHHTHNVEFEWILSNLMVATNPWFSQIAYSHWVSNSWFSLVPILNYVFIHGGQLLGPTHPEHIYLCTYAFDILSMYIVLHASRRTWESDDPARSLWMEFGKKRRAPGTLPFIRIQNNCERLRIRRGDWKKDTY